MNLLVPTKALTDVLVERDAQDLKWGEQNHDPITYIAILVEEVGEMTHDALHSRFATSEAPTGQAGSAEEYRQHMQLCMRTEAVHVAAVALAIVECIDRDKWEWPESKTKEVKHEH